MAMGCMMVVQVRGAGSSEKGSKAGPRAGGASWLASGKVYVPKTIIMSTDLDVPPYLTQPLIPAISPGAVSCAQALGMHNTPASSA